MQKEIIKNKIMDKYRSYFFIIIFCFFILDFFVSCDRKSNTITMTELFLDSITSKITDNRFPLKTIRIINNKDSVLIDRSYSNYTFRSIFLKIGNNYFEIRKRGNKDDIELGTDSILTFAAKDTIFIYNSEVDFTPRVFDYTLADCRYKIKKNNSNYITVKQSLVDTTYKEIYFYDKNYNIYKYINTWQNNKCVYVRREQK